MQVFLWPITDVKIRTPWRSQMGDLEGLKRSIATHGLLHPIVLLPDGTLVVGYRRWLACRDLGWESIPALILAGLDDLRGAQLDENALRKGLTLRERARVAREVLNQKIAEAQERRTAGLKRGQNHPETPSVGEQGEALDLAAKLVGMSGRQLRKIFEMEAAAQSHPEVLPMLERMDEIDKVGGIHKAVKSLLAEKAIAAAMPTRIDTGEFVLQPDRLICADVRQLLPSIPAATFDSVLWDAPYGVGKVYGDWTETDFDPVAYWTWLGPIFEEVYRVLKPGGFLAIFQSQKYFPFFWQWFGENIRIFIAARDWLYFTSGERQIHAYDPVVCLYKSGGERLVPSMRGRAKDYYVSKMKFDSLAHYAHPCPKALDICQYLVENWTPRGAFVFDPMCGLGSLCVAAKLCGRRFLGVERHPKYIRIAEERLRILTDWDTVARLSTKGVEEVREGDGQATGTE